MYFENVVFYLGIIFCVSASAYVIHSGYKLAGLFLLIGFVLHAQSALYMQFVGHPDNTGECWATVQDYYACLPIMAKVTIHLGQASSIFLALGLFVIAKQKIVAKNGS